MPHSSILTPEGHVISSTFIKQINSGGEKEIMRSRRIFRAELLETAAFLPSSMV
jgi:hypothetical protein